MAVEVYTTPRTPAEQAAQTITRIVEYDVQPAQREAEGLHGLARLIEGASDQPDHQIQGLPKWADDILRSGAIHAAAIALASQLELRLGLMEDSLYDVADQLKRGSSEVATDPNEEPSRD